LTFREALQACPLIASVQASPGSPLSSPEVLWPSALASLQQGVQILRLQGVDAISTMKARTAAPVIGLIKRDYPGSEVYITPTKDEVDQLLALKCEVVALDATLRPRPHGESFSDLVARIRRGGAIPMADCDSLESLEQAIGSGCGIASTTLAGYTGGRPAGSGPDLELLRSFVRRGKEAGILILAEGRFQEPRHVRAAVAMGADGVVVGGSLNDPVKQTLRLIGGLPQAERVGAVDLGGTWLRFAVVNSRLEIESLERIPTPSTRSERMDWVLEMATRAGVQRVGISAGGTVDPSTGEVWEAKDFIPDYRGTVWRIPGLKAWALNDGLSTAWGHAHQPQWAGLRVAALALGTGVGAGLVSDGAILHGPRGEYPRWNDMAMPGETGTVEEALGGLALAADPGDGARERAVVAACSVAESMGRLWMPDVIVVTGGVGQAPWMREAIKAWASSTGTRVEWGHDEAGLLGGAALAIHPPETLRN
jgi:putative N-acetylmannosamine-6-phosphate epimerase/predicted NBD/HSP70 family sugar kinase